MKDVWVGVVFFIGSGRGRSDRNSSCLIVKYESGEGCCIGWLVLMSIEE